MRTDLHDGTGKHEDREGREGHEDCAGLDRGGGWAARRGFIGGSLALGGLALGAASRAAAPPTAAAASPSTAAIAMDGTRLVLLGTAGGPRPNRARSSPAQVLVIDGAAYVVDCGSGVARQLVFAGVPLNTVRRVLVTHHHSDHNADYGNLLYLSWISGLRAPVDTHGPAPLAAMTELYLKLNAYDVETRIADEGRVPFAPLLRAHELAGPGLVFEDERVKVTATLVDHPPVVPAYAYRFDAADRSIVLSGDTAYNDGLVRMAEGADVLVHEVYDPAGAERLVGRMPNATTLLEHIVASHTTAEEAGRAAQAAGVKTLVLTHFVPSDDPLISDDAWLQAARAHFRGEVIVGEDLRTI